MADFYNENDPFTVTEKDRKKYQKMLDDLEDWEKDLLAKSDNFYMVDLSNKGGLVMPAILGIYYSDGSEEEVRLPAELWRMDAENVTKLLVRDKFIDQIVVDPHLETADVDIENNYWPRRIMKSRLELFKRERFGPSRNLMKDMLVSEDDADNDESEEQDADAPETEASIDGDGSDILDGPLNEDALNDQQPNAGGRAANEGEPAAPDAPSFQN